MSELIKLGCTVADAYHRYHEIHGTLFGASLLSRTLNALRGREKGELASCAKTLVELQDKLTTLETQLSNPVQDKPLTGADRELSRALLAYTRSLNRAVISLENICTNLDQDEATYRRLRADGRSQFTADKLDYDQLLSELERLGTRLEKLFSSY